MKTFYLIIFVFTIYIAQAVTPDFYPELSIGNVAVNGFKNGGNSTMDVFQVGIIEANTGLGLTTYILPFDPDTGDFLSDLFPLELNWQPFFSPETFIAAKLFFRADNYLQITDPFDFRTGARVDFKINFDKILYPFISIEAGYWYRNGFYLSGKVDPLVLLGVFDLVLAIYEYDSI